MFEVLAFVYENFWGGDSCPELLALQRKLNAVGFDNREVDDALLWLEDLKSATRQLRKHNPDCASMVQPPPDVLPAPPTSQAAIRVFTAPEQAHLGVSGWGFITFLVSIGVLPSERLELVMERAMAAPGDPVNMDDLKLIVLMVFWSLGEEPQALVLDELCDNRDFRLPN
jgi:Smg protein